jgi:pimeloyl-ACP methyl ester carboxylesterase
MGDFPRVPLAPLMHDPEVMIGQFVKLARLARADAERVEALWGELLRDHAALSPLVRAETVPGCGHLIHLEAPSLTVVAIASLVRDQPRASDPPPPDSKRPTGP